MSERLRSFHVLAEGGSPEDNLRQIIRQLGGSESTAEFIAGKAVNILVEGKFPWGWKRVVFDIPGSRVLTDGKRGLRLSFEGRKLEVSPLVRIDDGSWYELPRSAVLFSVSRIVCGPCTTKILFLGGGSRIWVDDLKADFGSES